MRKSLFLLFLMLSSSCSSKAPAVPSEFPLQKGTTWTYSYQAYEPSPTDPAQVIHARYQLMETVTDTETTSPYFIAHVKKDYQLIEIDPAWTGNFEASQPNEYWYVVQDDKVFESRFPLDTNSITTEEFLLDYDFPLSLSSAWCRPPLQAKNLNAKDVGSCEWVGQRMVTNQGPHETPAGKFEDCYELTDYANGGNVLQWFCRGVGIVAMRFDHAGTRFGYEQILTGYSKGTP